MLRKTSWKESPEDGGGETRRRGLSAARCLNHSVSGKAAGWYQLATQDRHVRGLCPLTRWLCWNLPGQLEIPKLVLRTPEPSGSSWGLLLPAQQTCHSVA